MTGQTPLTADEVASRWGHTAAWWQDQARRGLVEAYRVGRSWRFTEAAIEAAYRCPAAGRPASPSHGDVHPSVAGLSPRSRAHLRRTA